MLNTLLIHQHYALNRSWQQLRHAPLVSLLTVAVLSIALLLPTALLVLLNNAQQLTQRWDTSIGMTVYLQTTATTQQAQSVLQTIQQRSDISKAIYISPQQGMAEFIAVSGLDDAFNVLDANPLPGVIKITPQDLSPSALQGLQSQLQQLPQVASVNFDMQWLKRLMAIVQLSKDFIYGLLGLLSLAVLLIIGNTIRTHVERYHREIEVLKLIGASNHFIRRPFLYTGILYGFAAGVVAVILVNIFVFGLQTPVANLANLYGSQFTLQGLNLIGTLSLLLFSVILGYLGSWVALQQHLMKVEIR